VAGTVTLLGRVPGGGKSAPRRRLASVQRSRQSPDDSAKRERESEAGLSEAKGTRRQPPATGDRRACERCVVAREATGCPVPENPLSLGRYLGSMAPGLFSDVGFFLTPQSRGGEISIIINIKIGKETSCMCHW